MFTISLHRVKIFAPLGLYPEELLTGNEFEVDLDVRSDKNPEEAFVDYVVLNRLIHEAFDAGHHTLEAICAHIHRGVGIQFPFALQTKVCIRKLHPPMSGTVGCAQVCLDL
jgi:dihydroneopterin aldolase